MNRWQVADDGAEVIDETSPVTWNSLQAWWATDEFKRGRRDFDEIVATQAVVAFLLWCAK